jgi:hypothetical protein
VNLGTRFGRRLGALGFWYFLALTAVEITLAGLTLDARAFALASGAYGGVWLTHKDRTDREEETHPW